ncbi:MAG: phosphate acyltransferase [Isosphaeraceae bacterium]|jgi:glycerol-3-phosphate acyltransferase PlsX|nr:MAG: phosphate acyltransferase [Isosphaeraceae bacterium]
MRIALDAMGGDHAPGPIVAGAVQAAQRDPALTVLLVGDEPRIAAELERHPDLPRDRLPIVHASEVIGMHEKPVEALRKKRDNSISRCWLLLAQGEAHAVVSAGNTGAMVGAGLFNAKMFLPGVRRPGIAAVYPTLLGPAVLIDVGANMHPKPEDLYQYGVMGAIYAQHVLGIDNPTIGLLNVGAEEDKGNELVRDATRMFRSSQFADRFVGNVEGRDIHDGRARVIVCEGFTGNILLKSGEGAVEFLFSELKKELGLLLPRLSPEDGQLLVQRLRDLKTRYEYHEFGGAPLLGIRGACIICHGSSDDRAIRNAIRVAAVMAEDRISAEISTALTSGTVAHKL